MIDRLTVIIFGLLAASVPPTVGLWRCYGTRAGSRFAVGSVVAILAQQSLVAMAASQKNARLTPVDGMNPQPWLRCCGPGWAGSFGSAPPERVGGMARLEFTHLRVHRVGLARRTNRRTSRYHERVGRLARPRKRLMAHSGRGLVRSSMGRAARMLHGRAACALRPPRGRTAKNSVRADLRGRAGLGAPVGDCPDGALHRGQASERLISLTVRIMWSSIVLLAHFLLQFNYSIAPKVPILTVSDE